MNEPNATRSVVPRNYSELKQALVAASGDIAALGSLLVCYEDGGKWWVDGAYEDLRRALAQGRLSDGAELGELLTTVLQLQQSAGSGPAAVDVEIQRESVQCLVDAIAAVLDQDFDTGMETLQNITEMEGCAESLRWVAWHWLGRAASEVGDLDRAHVAAESAQRISDSLHGSARSASLIEISQLKHQMGDTKGALKNLTTAIAICERTGDVSSMASALLVRAQMQAVAGEVTAAIESATQARQASPDWEQPVIFLARQALIEGRLDQAAWVLQLYYQKSPQPVAIQRELRLVELGRQGVLPAEAICEYTRLRDHPPTDETIAALELLLEQAPNFVQARELLAWTLFKRGYDHKAASQFEELALEDVDAETRQSVLLGLGCLANRRNRHRQLGARLYAARTAATTIAAPAGDSPQPASGGALRQVPTEGVVTALESDPGEAGDERVVEFDEMSSRHLDRTGVGRRLRQARAVEQPRRTHKTAPKVALTGDLSLFAVPDLLEFLRSSRRTGTLVVTTEAGIGVVQLRLGMLVGAASPNSLSIGRSLVQIGAVTEAQLAEVTQSQQREGKGKLLGALLVERGFVSESDIHNGLAEQMRSAVYELIQWTTGAFAFDPDHGDQATSEIEVELELQGVLLDALRQLDESRR